MGILKRQSEMFVDDDGDDRDYYFWHTTEGETIRWAVFAGLVSIFLLWMILGRWHANRRIQKGLPPLAYHRWLLSRRQRTTHDPSYQPQMPYYTTYRPANQEYGMHAFPPPVYDHNSPPPPTYQPPPGASKMDPNQGFGQTSGTTRVNDDDAPAYTPPAGPPPPTQAHLGSGAGSDPYRL